jgi:glycine/D-amino acid oxidase-like deaminating enzyme
MKINRSPWIHQLNKEREVEQLSKDIETDIAIIGAGIAGVSTAYFLLKNTAKSIVMIEKYKLAQGATGHNAGQVVGYFERALHDIAKEFGPELTASAQRAIDSTWDLLSEMYTDTKLATPLSRFIGHTGYSSLDQFLNILKDIRFRKENNLDVLETLVAENSPFLSSVQEADKDLFRIVPHKEILERLETDDKNFSAVVSSQKGTLNSALFCEEVMQYMQKNYSHRFTLYEKTPIHKIVLHDNVGLLDAGAHMVAAHRVILCTNGFENISIVNKANLALDKSFHNQVTGIVARMSGYLEKYNKPPMSLCYCIDEKAGFDNMEDPYYYLTRRMYEYEKGQHHNLICIGGPQHSIADREEYMYEYDYPEEVQKELDQFVHKIYNFGPNHKIDYKFTWHGLMGYTSNQIRRIGPEMQNPILMYNLGCNGVGILPSIYGGKRIADMVAGKKIKPMIFDPQNQKV